MEGSEGVVVNERGAERESAGCGVEHGVFVGVGVDGLGVPDPKETKPMRRSQMGKIECSLRSNSSRSKNNCCFFIYTKIVSH